MWSVWGFAVKIIGKNPIVQRTDQGGYKIGWVKIKRIIQLDIEKYKYKCSLSLWWDVFLYEGINRINTVDWSSWENK